MRVQTTKLLGLSCQNEGSESQQAIVEKLWGTEGSD